MQSFKKHVINFAGLKGEKKSILENFFLKVSFRGHSFNRKKSHVFVAGTFPSLELDDVLKVSVILRANKDRRHFLQILENLDLCSAVEALLSRLLFCCWRNQLIGNFCLSVSGVSVLLISIGFI